MQMKFENVGNTLIVKLYGELDHHTCEDIRSSIDDEIISKCPKNIIFDMNDLNFMDSSGIGVIIGRYKLIAASGGKVYIANLKPQVKRVCDICGLQKLIPIYNNLRQALDNI